MRILILCCALAGLASASRAEPRAFLGFRLLVIEDQLVRWESGSALTYAFVTEPMAFPGARNCGAMLPPGPMLARSRVGLTRFKGEVALAFGMWEAVAKVTFRETGDPREANILIGAQAEPRGRAFTNVKLDERAKPGKKVIEQSLICLNPEMPWKIGFDGDLAVYDLRYTVAHEIGHAIGLDHPSPSGQLMSYRYDERHDRLQPGDVAGALLLYGRRQPTRVGSSPPSIGIAPAANTARRVRTPPALGLGERQDHAVR